jgi:hypothetical protein
MMTLRRPLPEGAAVPLPALTGKSVPELVIGHNPIDLSQCVGPWRNA